MDVVPYLLWIFQILSSLISLNLSSFDLSSMTNMGSMFYKCNSLKFVDTSYLNTSSLSKITLVNH